MNEKLKKNASKYKSWVLRGRQICDLEMILNRGFSPLNGFLNKEDYENVLTDMRLLDGSVWPMPITLDVNSDFSKSLSIGDNITLKDKEGFSIAVLEVEDKWEPDLNKEAELIFGTKDVSHPGVDYLLNYSNNIYIGGKVELIDLPHHYDYKDLRLSPKILKKKFKDLGWDNIVAFQTRNPLHKAHVEMTLKALEDLDANLLIHPVVGMTKAGDVDHYTRVRCYQHVLEKYPANKAILSLIPLAMRMGGPREALWHALIRKNYGCTHLIVGRDHAGPGLNKEGNPFYGPYDAQEMLQEFEEEIGIKMVPFKFLVYLPDENIYKPIDEISNDTNYKTVSGTELRDYLDKGKDIPEWFTYKEVANELQKSQPPISKRGFTIFFTGLSGSGKSTLANGLLIKLLENGNKPVTLLDGDIVRTHLSSELGFSKEHRSLNVKRIGYVASEITKNGGIAICAPIAPYEKDRFYNRNLISKLGGYIEIHVSTSLEKCEERDVKGLYKLARKGIVKEFTGVSDPYEAPPNAELVIDSSDVDPEKLVEKIYDFIKSSSFI
ncbi:bifunctional sulfate adenylyltransferase/adenylylsulfate kinase [bacterium]|jgi:sulfate adenylyltransferase|nr:bifunctional sulfate adenylyltransferase/adenylylsulfate kinase [bacterium]MBT4927825.1 bifunctional sulfate adenylyltransferase/adenylylsulfate kinase [bacterium]